MKGCHCGSNYAGHDEYTEALVTAAREALPWLQGRVYGHDAACDCGGCEVVATLQKALKPFEEEEAEPATTQAEPFSMSLAEVKNGTGFSRTARFVQVKP